MLRPLLIHVFNVFVSMPISTATSVSSSMVKAGKHTLTALVVKPAPTSKWMLHSGAMLITPSLSVKIHTESTLIRPEVQKLNSGVA